MTENWAVKQVWGDSDFSDKGDVAEGQYAFVIDTGVALLDDLNVNTEWSKSFVGNEPDPHGPGSTHGTAVASIIGSKANGEGLTGVAPGAQIIALKALNDSGWGSGKNIGEALEYARDIIVENNLFDSAVVNLSLGGGTPNNHPVVEEMAELGIKVVVAAGNNGRDVDGFSPASYGHLENVYTISSTDRYGGYSSFTNFDGLDINGLDDVDFAAPGRAIESYGTDGYIRNRNGTSFAAPMVAGLLLMSEKIRPGGTFELSEVQTEKGMIPDAFALFDPYTYKHGERPEGPAPEGWYDLPPEAIAPTGPQPDPIVIEVPVEVPVYIEVPGPVVEVPIEVPVYIDRPVPVDRPVYIDRPVPTPVPIDPIIGYWEQENRLKGTEDTDVIYGGMKKDVLQGKAGDDVLLGFGGNDKLKAGAGDDIIFGGNNGKAKMWGGKGADTFYLAGGEGYAIIKDFDLGQGDRIGVPFEYDLTYSNNWTKIWVEGDLVAKVAGTHTEFG